MKDSKDDLVQYRLSRAKETFEDAKILADKSRWNSAINRLYYAAYYAVTALLISEGINPTTHNGAKAKFSEHFILTKKITKDLGKTYSQLFTWRQKGDYDDLFDFDEEKVNPYFDPVDKLIQSVETLLTSS